MSISLSSQAPKVQASSQKAKSGRFRFERSRKAMFMSLGFMTTGLAIVGAFLPLLPTVPFLLLSAYFFSKASEKWHNWLYQHPKFGPMLRDWHERGAIPRKAKLKSCAIIAASFSINIYTLYDRPYILALVGFILLCSITFIMTRPD